MRAVSQDAQQPRHALEELYRRMEARSHAITETQPAWPCRRGCAHCILGMLKQHGDGGIVWGNHDALEETAKRLGGPVLTLFEWFAAYPQDVR
jgi:hypothetical protein